MSKTVGHSPAQKNLPFENSYAPNRPLSRAFSQRGSMSLIDEVLIPEVMVSCTLRGVSAARRVPSTALFLIVVAMSDVMSINFFFLVKDEGSWLEIGTSISHFVINSAVIIFLPLFNLIGYIYTSDPKESHCLHKKTALD